MIMKLGYHILSIKLLGLNMAYHHKSGAQKQKEQKQRLLQLKVEKKISQLFLTFAITNKLVMPTLIEILQQYMQSQYV